METSKRGQWGSSFGFLMASIGSAIGLGNLWGFPYKMGKTGGFAFLIIYLILVALVGIVLMLGEFALGRKTGKGAGGAYAALAKILLHRLHGGGLPLPDPGLLRGAGGHGPAVLPGLFGPDLRL
ncbi:MAG: hypothetical protein MR910_01690 [Clostridiales bacterium]|nr:hypothetical protein [Clostridiales bacterium]